MYGTGYSNGRLILAGSGCEQPFMRTAVISHPPPVRPPAVTHLVVTAACISGLFPHARGSPSPRKLTVTARPGGRVPPL